MPPRPTWYRGREAVARLPRASTRWPARTAGASCPSAPTAQLAFGHYLWDAERGAFVPHGVNVLTLRGDQIADITTFLTQDAIDRLGLGPIDAEREAPGAREVDV